jgi:Cu/Ag efflux protein CusF
MNRTCLSVLWVAAVGAALALPARAQTPPNDHAAHHPPGTNALAGLSSGEIRKVDREAAKLTIRHGEIKHLDMPPMTMVFQVKDAALIGDLKAGDKVRFRAEKDASGYVVTAIEPAR